MAESRGGWGEPRVRLLRTVAAFLLCGLLAYMVVDGRDTVALGTILGALLILLGFEGLRAGPWKP